jgi:hypothetical protein
MVLAAFCIALSVLWFVDAGIYMATYGVEVEGGGIVFGRRMAPVILGLGIMLYLARDEPPSPLRRIICIAVAVVFAGVGCTGILAYMSGEADIAIIVAASVEVLVAMLAMTVAQAR